ncbi:hypothetical protein [Planctobacterium marinum]|uniref:hypothetical protein n=1 Tax=Planctobacterium marinum TaxID=1631968 RepID=UPI001E604773|nr:hypothetical protein [Planctobacterium marinum]MCC2607898.1 hypothetical protein [Planctobacterium marinum]
MLGKVKGLLVLGTGVLVSGVATAGEVSLSEVTDFYVYSATSSTSYEVQNEVYSDILNTSHKVELEDIGVETKVLITFDSTVSSSDVTEAAE